MRQEEANALIQTIEAAYRITMTPETKAVYSEFFRTIDFDHGKLAVNNAIGASTFPPNVAEINAQLGELPGVGGDEKEEAEIAYAMRTYKGLSKTQARGMVRERAALLKEFNANVDDPAFDIPRWEAKWDALGRWVPAVVDIPR